MSKPDAPANEAGRIKALRDFEILDTLAEGVYDNITRLAAELCKTPIALISLIDENRQWFKSRHGRAAPETPRDLSFCGHAILQKDGVFQVTDSTKDPRFSDNPVVTGDARVIFYAGAPLKTSQGFQIGTLCVIDHQPRALTDDQSRMLSALADQVIALFDLRLGTAKLQKTQAQLADTIESISDAYVSWDKNWIINDVNEAHVKASKIPREQQVGKSFLDIFLPDSEHRNSKYWSEYHRAMEQRVRVDFEDYYPPLDLWTSVTAHPKADGGIALFFRDINPEKKREREVLAAHDAGMLANLKLLESRQYLETTLRSIGDAVIATTANVEPKISFLNSVAEELTGWKAAEAVGRPVAEVFKIINVKTRKPAVDPISRVIREGKTVGLANHTALINRSGEEIIIEDSAAPIRGEDGTVQGVVLVFRNVSEKIALEERTALLNAVVENSQDFIGIANPDGSARYVNPAGRRLLGLKDEEVQQTQIIDYFAEEEKNRIVHDALPSVLSTGSWDGRVEFKNFSTGEHIPFSWNVFSIPDEETGGIAAIACVSKDLRETDRRQSVIDGEKLKLAQILMQMPIGVCLLEGPEHRFSFVNPRYYDLFGGERAISGKTVLNALPELNGTDLPKILDSVYQSGQPFYGREYPVMLLDASGNPQQLYLNFSYEPMREADQRIYGISVSVVNVTDLVTSRKILEAQDIRLQLALNAGQIGTWDLDPVTKELIWSKRGAEMYGFHGLTRTSYEVFMDRVHPEDRPKVNANVAASTAANGNKRYDLEYRIVLPNGEIKTIRAAGITLFKEKGGSLIPMLFTGTVIDITEQVYFQAELTKAKDAAEMANSAKSAFLANMSHEIRTPLGAIMGFAELLKNPRLGKIELGNFISVIERNSHHLLRIVDDILDLSKVEAGKMLFESIEILVPAFLADISSLFGFKAREKGIAFDLKFENSVPEIVMSDPTRLRQIVTNMVGNAIKFTSRGGVELMIRYVRGELVFTVKDTGRGISEDQAGKLFQAFSQADESTTREFGGTGLGLILTRRLAKAMGGDFILKSSTLGQGSTFAASVSVDVPSGTKMVNASRAHTPELMLNLNGNDRLSGKKLLVVDDSPDNRTLISVILGEQGALVDLASDGYLALEHAMANAYDLVFLDIQMPGMDGYQALKLLRERNPRLPVIAITAHAMAEERARAKSAGFNDFVTKPVQRETLVRSAEAVFRKATIDQPDSTCDVLIVEDDQDIRDLFGQVLEMSGYSYLTSANGKGALDLLEGGARPKLILLDLSLPDIPGSDIIARIRSNSAWRKFNVVIVSGWDQLEGRARKLGADGSLKKPVEINALEALMAKFFPDRNLSESPNNGS